MAVSRKLKKNWLLIYGGRGGFKGGGGGGAYALPSGIRPPADPKGPPLVLF